ncbi:hypothetical protein ENHYD8BJ_80259 [Enhydrobacter sp. 8BJ]|nr:hypothetical protein ENHYD8BJ_80259 [Enhydrobacter sp. 8BJ]
MVTMPMNRVLAAIGATIAHDMGIFKFKQLSNSHNGIRIFLAVLRV